MHSFVQKQHMCMAKNVGGSGMGDRPCKITFFGCSVYRRGSSFYADWHVGLVDVQIEWCYIVLYVIVLVCVRWWADGWVVEARRVKAND